MITVALLAALGRDEELKRHLGGAFNLKVSPVELEAIIIHVALRGMASRASRHSDSAISIPHKRMLAREQCFRN